MPRRIQDGRARPYDAGMNELHPQGPATFRHVAACMDPGNLKSGRGASNFGWAARLPDGPWREGDWPDDLADLVAERLIAGGRVALGVEAPLFVPVPEAADDLGTARKGEGSYAWSSHVGSTVAAMGMQQLTWLLAAVALRISGDSPTGTVSVSRFKEGGATLLLWEAFVAGARKPVDSTHIGDARAAVLAFDDAFESQRSAVTAGTERVLNVGVAAGLAAGWDFSPKELSYECLVVAPDEP